MKELKKVFIAYLTLGALIMIILSIHGFLSLTYPNYEATVNSFIYPSFFGYIISFAFMISIFNLPVFGVSAVVLLIKRQMIGLSALLLLAAISYFTFGKMMGDGW